MRIIGNNPAADNAEITAVASGTLPDGKAVVVNTDGTVSVVETSAASSGTPVVFENADTRHSSVTYDINAQKVVIAYRDRGNSDYGTAIVGTVSDTSISFGSPTVFETATVPHISATYDANAQKIVIAYADSGNSSYGTAIVGTVSGTNISFGSAVVFESADTNYVSATYDSSAQKIVIAYNDGGNSSHGTAIVGTVSGTSISFGSAVVFESASANHTSVIYDSNAQKVVVAYQDNGNSGHGTAIVGTVSGTSISFGSATVFESANSDNVFITYDANAQKVVIIYTDGGNSDYGTAIVGTVSGTSISFGSAVVFENDGVSHMSSAYDANAQRVVIAYRDGGNSGDGTSVVFKSPAQNLTSENFIGFSNAAYADTQTATIEVGSAINNGQSSLTIGQQYFVQTDGTIGLTADDPSVIAGTAISATEIIVKG